MGHSLYVHIPVCLQKCTYCDFFSNPGDVCRLDSIVDTLCQEIAIRTRDAAVTRWDTVYIGGGTPSLLSGPQLELLTDAIKRAAPLRDHAEWTIEANPEDITRSWLEACSGTGITRLSVGIQSMNDLELSSVGRRGNRQTNLKALELIRLFWNNRLSIDLISGLPGQTGETLQETLAHIVDTKANHVSLYALTLEEGTPLERAAARGSVHRLPEGDHADALWLQGRDALERSGFAQYEISNFAIPGYESRHNMVYWRMGDWIAAGPSASGTLRHGEGALRTTDASNISLWLGDPISSADTEALDRRECERECLIMGMRLREGLDRRAFAFRFGRDILEITGETCRIWQRKGKLEISDDRIALTGEGLLLLNSFLRECLEEMD